MLPIFRDGGELFIKKANKKCYNNIDKDYIPTESL